MADIIEGLGKTQKSLSKSNKIVPSFKMASYWGQTPKEMISLSCQWSNSFSAVDPGGQTFYTITIDEVKLPVAPCGSSEKKC